MSFSDVARHGRVLICCGTGGVGKTTAAAAIALQAAGEGRRAAVVTIDPAKRLADALGVESLTNEPARIDGDWDGQLWALMLDTKTTFDALVTKYAPTPEQAQAILENRFYRNISSVLSGTQEYMAMEKLFELNREKRFDLIVVDTPPTRHALDFLDAPRRLTRLLDSRVFRWLITPTRAYLKAVSLAGQVFLRSMGKAVGSEVISDAVAFFQAFEGMEEGFRRRAREVLDLLSSPRTTFVLVTSPRQEAVQEGTFFADKLAESGLAVGALVINRVHPHFGPGRAEDDRRKAATLGPETPLGLLYGNRADFRQMAEEEERNLAGLARQVAPAPVVRVPLLPSDVHDLAGLTRVAACLADGSGVG